MDDYFVENVMWEMVESALFRSEDRESVESALKDAYENDEYELHDALFSTLMRDNTKEGLAHTVVYYLCARAKETG
ncbi:MAG: hypothetical protein OXG07_01825 [Anaerolineaceae bacterium]|nr:hypothetical protein [Anaerolineaceae bacterium]MCY3908390.1 hypothetical protein [Anaerolineaceae bacterium]